MCIKVSAEYEEEKGEDKEEKGGWEEAEGGWEEGDEKEGDEEGEEETSGPMFVPTKGIFFQHDDRCASGEGEEQEQM